MVRRRAGRLNEAPYITISLIQPPNFGILEDPRGTDDLVMTDSPTLPEVVATVETVLMFPKNSRVHQLEPFSRVHPLEPPTPRDSLIQRLHMGGCQN